MIHSLIVTSREGYLLFGRYFKDLTRVERCEWERELLSISRPYWGNDQSEEIVTSRDKMTVLKSMDDTIVFATGHDEYDEFVLTEILEIFLAVLRKICNKKLTETKFLANFSKICIAVDEMFVQAHLENTSLNSIMQMSKLKAYKVN